MTRKSSTLTLYRAVEIAEGFGYGETASEQERLQAWQYLIDTGHAWKLQGFFGRTAERLIESGICTAAKIKGAK